MKNQFFKKLIAFLVGIFLTFSAFPAYGDTKTDTSETPFPTLAENIPASVAEFIDGNFSSITEVMTNSLSKSYTADDIELGTPYIVYNFNEYQDEVYYYPLIADGKIKAILGVIGTDWGYTYEISYDHGFIELLTEMDYLNNECIFYTINDELYYESANGVQSEPDIPMGYSEGKMPDADELAFAAMSFEEKQRVVNDKLSSFKYVDTQKNDENDNDDIKYGAMKAITLRNKRSQYNYGMCWACVVATIANTLNWTSYTGYDVCNRMGIGFDTGAGIDEIKTALSYYGVDYKKTTSKLPWSSVVKNIDAGYPIAMIMDPYPSGDLGHSVTLYGYDKSNNIIRIWNSQIENSDETDINYNMEGYYKDVYYYNARYDITSSKPVPLSEQGRVYIWKQTLSEYQ